MTFKAYEVSNLTTGLLTSRDALLLPEDGFQKLENCHLQDGVLEKRKGNQLIDVMVSTTNFGTSPDPILTTDDTDTMMGILDHKSNGNVRMLAFNTTRANFFNGASKEFSDLTRRLLDFNAASNTWTNMSIGDTVFQEGTNATSVIENIYIKSGTIAGVLSLCVC